MNIEDHSRDLLNSFINFFMFPAYIYIRGEFYNEASNLQVAINEVMSIPTFSFSFLLGWLEIRYDMQIATLS